MKKRVKRDMLEPIIKVENMNYSLQNRIGWGKRDLFALYIEKSHDSSINIDESNVSCLHISQMFKPPSQIET